MPKRLTHVVRPRIEICGGIASGKTTLAHILASDSDHELALEDFPANPFWKLSYQEPFKYRIEKNVCFIAQHTGAIKAAKALGLLICDFAVLQDLAYAKMEKSDEHVSAMRALFQHLYLPLSPPSLVIYLRCNAYSQLRRIRARARTEEASISIDYLQALNSCIEEILSEAIISTPVHIVESDQVDFAHNKSVANSIREEVMAMVGTPLG